MIGEAVASPKVGSPKLLGLVQRLRAITGFATVYGEQFDQRVDVFARLWHVRRVIAVTRLIAPYWPAHNHTRVLWLTWLHDVNRWPFAHNSERGRFNQATNTPSFFANGSGVSLSPSDCDELVRIQRKELDGLSTEAQLVLVADAVTGVVEDSLMLICGLNVRPDVVPNEVARLLGFAHGDEPWHTRSAQLAALLHGRTSSQVNLIFRSGVRRLFLEQVRCFLTHMLKNRTFLDPRRTLDTVRLIKAKFVVPFVFPINNGLVCQADWLSDEVIPWYLRTYGEEDLVHLTEQQFVERVLARSSFPSHKFVPKLDVICREYRDTRMLSCDWAQCPSPDP